MEFSSIAKAGIDKIYKEDIQSQRVFIENICSKARHMDSNIIYKAQGFYVPNDNYMTRFFGGGITQSSFDCYDGFGDCYWLGFLVFPIYNLVDEIVGFVGFNPINKLKSKEPEFWNLTSYRHSGKSLFDKSKHIFSLQGVVDKAIKDGYIILTDGVFDTLSAVDCGLNAGALLGSYVGEALLVILKFIDRIYLSMDNDEAGLKLLNTLKYYRPDVMAIKQNKFKDLDDVLTSQYREIFLEQFKQHNMLKYKTDLILRFK